MSKWSGSKHSLLSKISMHHYDDSKQNSRIAKSTGKSQNENHERKTQEDDRRDSGRIRFGSIQTWRAE